MSLLFFMPTTTPKTIRDSYVSHNIRELENQQNKQWKHRQIDCSSVASNCLKSLNDFSRHRSFVLDESQLVQLNGTHRSNPAFFPWTATSLYRLVNADVAGFTIIEVVFSTDIYHPVLFLCRRLYCGALRTRFIP